MDILPKQELSIDGADEMENNISAKQSFICFQNLLFDLP